MLDYDFIVASPKKVFDNPKHLPICIIDTTSRNVTMGDYFLFIAPDLISGMARVLDLGNTLNEYNTSATPELADFRALRSDWAAVGQDLRAAMAQLDNEVATDGQEE